MQCTGVLSVIRWAKRRGEAELCVLRCAVLIGCRDVSLVMDGMWSALRYFDARKASCMDKAEDEDGAVHKLV